MSETISVNTAETGTEGKMETPDLSIFPESIRTLFDKLPDLLKKRIFSEKQRTETVSSSEKLEQSLEEIVASFDTRTREEFMARCLFELFENGRFKDMFKSVDEENLGQEVERLLNLLWQNRGKRDDVQLFNQEYYDNFFQGRVVITKRLGTKKLEIKKLNDSIATTIKQKRLTEKKRDDLRKLEAEMNILIDELKKYDDQHDNSDLVHRASLVSYRQRKEREWTKAATITGEYLDPAEFSTVMAEH